MAADWRHGDNWPAGTSGKPDFGSHWKTRYRRDSRQLEATLVEALRLEQSPLKQAIEF
jgi:hypothetical protein